MIRFTAWNTGGVALVMALSAGGSAFAQQPAAVCSAQAPALRVAVFNTTATYDQPNYSARANAMATLLPQVAQQQNLDVLCLDELRHPDSRASVLQGFPAPTWNMYQPPPADQTGCQNACYPNNTVALQGCANSFLPNYDVPCIFLDTQLAFLLCTDQACPGLRTLFSDGQCGNPPDCRNPQCAYCGESGSPTESNSDIISRCSDNPYDPVAAANCKYGYGGQAGGTLLSRYPFLATGYHAFTPPVLQPGLSNWGVTYGKIQTPLGPVHLFCGSQATSESGMLNGADQPLNAAQSQEVLSYIQSLANGQPAIYMASTGSGPAVAMSSTGAANALWPDNFTILQSGLTDALLGNVDAYTSAPLPVPACTYGCSTSASTPASAYIDHIMSSGKGTNQQGLSANLCTQNGATLFTADTNGYGFLPSTHFGVYTEIRAQTSPTLVSVSSANSNGSYGAGKTVAITAMFSAPVVVSGSPQLALNSGGTAVYASGSGTATLTFTYTVATGQNSLKLDYTSTTALTLNGGTVSDSVGNVAALTLPVPGAAGSLSSNKNIAIDTTAPTVVSYSVLFGSQKFQPGSVARMDLPWQITGIQVVFSKPVTAVPGSLTGVAPSMVSGSGTTTVTWTINALTQGSFSLLVKGTGVSAIQDAAGNSLGGGADVAKAFKVLWGDFNGDGVVASNDMVLVNNARTAAYNIFADLNGDGVVDLNDVNIVRANIGKQLQ